jgi:hypothetical protein
VELTLAFTIYDASIPPMIRMLEALSKILDKAETQAKQKDIPLNSLLEAQLAPDMLPFTRQIQIASDAAKGCAARLSGVEAPSFPDEEKTFADLQARIAKTIDFLKSVDAAKCAGAESRTMTIKTPTRSFDMPGHLFVTDFAQRNFFFHVTTAYDLLRHKGIEIGKMDFLGSP